MDQTLKFEFRPGALTLELVSFDWELIQSVFGDLSAYTDEAPGMTLDDLLGDDVAELIRVNKLER